MPLHKQIQDAARLVQQLAEQLVSGARDAHTAGVLLQAVADDLRARAEDIRRLEVRVG